MSQGVSIANQARSQVIANHQAEYDRIHRQLRAEAGLPVESTRANGRMTEVEKLEKRMAKLRAALKEARAKETAEA